MRPFISRELGYKSLKQKGTGEQRQFWGTGNIENQDFDFGEQGSKAIYFCRTRYNSLKQKGTEEQRQFWGTGNIENQDFDFGE